MRIWMALVNAVYIIIAVMALEIIMVRSEPEAMARLTRPEVFTTPEELRQYLDFIKGYYSLNGKARYGKRKDQQAMEYLKYFKAIVNLMREKQQNQEKRIEYVTKQVNSKSKIIDFYDRLAKYLTMA